MKRWFLLVLTILTTLSVVCAQESEEKILGMSISSLLVVLPLLMIVLGMLFFLALYLRDHYGDVLDFFKGRMKRRRKGERIKKVINYPKEVQALQKQLPTLEPEEGAHRLSGLANKFFAEKFNIDYEFTHGELEKELKVEKESWASFPKKLSDLRYSGEPLSRKELNALVKEFWDIVKYEKIKRLTPTIVEKLRKRRLTFEIGLLKNLRRYLEKAKPEEKEKLTSTDVMRYFIKRQKENLSGLFKIFKKVQTDTSAEMKTQLETVGKVKDYFSDKLVEKQINDTLNLIEEAQEQITKGKIDQAKKTYRQAYHRYYKLPIEEQVPIIVELQKIQKRIHKYKKPPKIAQETVIDQVKEYFEKRLTGQKINKVNSLIEEAQEQITKGKINEAKKTCQQAYRLYYHLPIEEQAPALFQLRQIQERVKESEKDIERLEIEELAKDLGKLKSERDIYVILDKSDIHKKLNFLTKYVQKVEKQGVHSLKAGKVHLKEKLKDFIETAEKKEGKKLTPKEKKFLTRIKEVGSFYTRKEEALEKALKQTQKQIFSKLHNITKQIKIGLHPKTKKKIIKQIPRQIVKPELKPSTPPLPEKKETRALGEIEKLLLSLKKRRKERFYILRPAGKEFLDKIEATINTIKESEQKGIRALKHYEEEFIHSLSLLMGKKEEKVIPHTEEEKRMLEFLEHMKEEEMIHIEEQKLQREKERLKTKPLIETSKVKMDIKRLKNLEKEEEKIMRRLQKAPKKYPMPEKRIRRKRLEKYNWEITADEVRKKKTKEMHDLTKEEERILSKLNNLEKGFNS